MQWLRCWLVLIGALWVTNLLAQEPESPEATTLRVLTWNIWHGGREDGPEVGPQRVVDVIRDSQADLVAMQETYGSGGWIAEQLGFHFHSRGTNVSIMSRYPIIEDVSVHEEFKNVGAFIELPCGRRAACYSIWLPYGQDIWESGTRDLSDWPNLRKACAPSASDLRVMWEEIAQRLQGPAFRNIPLIVAGDFNAMSDLDYGEVGFDEYGVVAAWETTQVLLAEKFRDSFRELNPTPERMRDRTWTPRFPEQEQDRIDYIFYRGGGLQARESRVIDNHRIKFPSDHAAVLTTFQWPTTEKPIRDTFEGVVVSYNIRHGRGIDGQVDLIRIGKVLKELAPDFVGLQEVDDGVRRSGRVNQARELSRQLGMHPAFGKFMEHDGGRYGMALLSKHPLIRVDSIPLPAGGEPRIALAAEVLLPNDERLTVVNVHFDWLEEDRARFTQAEVLMQYLQELKTPFLLIGDFNDRVGSRTLELLSQGAVAAIKPTGQEGTFPSPLPTTEIDFVFAVPSDGWEFFDTIVVPEAVASDHRPVQAKFRLKTR